MTLAQNSYYLPPRREEREEIIRNLGVLCVFAVRFCLLVARGVNNREGTKGGVDGVE